MKELYLEIVQDALEIFLKSIIIGFEPKHFAIYIASAKEHIDQVPRYSQHSLLSLTCYHHV